MWSDLLQQAQGLQAELSAWRQHLHQHPELSGQEAQTAQFVATTLSALGLKVECNFAGTHAVTTLLGADLPGPAVALRADLDALPIEEHNAVAYASRQPGVMHACGHDAHTTMLLGAAHLLCLHQQELKGPVRLIFQPAEESNYEPGALALVEAGILNDPPIAAIFGLHVYPDLPVGQFATRSGPMMASADSFRVTLSGKGAHAARPHQGIDPILMATQAINALHQLVSRRVDPLMPAVLTLGWIKGGHAENVIPESVSFGGTVRTLNSQLRQDFPRWIEKTLEGVAQAHGGSAELAYQWGTAPVINEAAATLYTLRQLRGLAGPEQVMELELPSMGGEDFGEYLQQVPGCFFRIGTRSPEQESAPPLHSPHFDIDERALPYGAAALAALALGWQG